MSATAAPVSPFPGYCFPPEIISHAVWLYRRFCLSLRDVEELLAERGIRVSYGDPSLVPQVRHAAGKRASSAPSTTGGKWYLYEVALTMNKRRYWPWRAVDQDGRCWTSWSRVDATSMPQSASSIACWTRGTASSLG